ncbi:MAG: hypothetical protein M5U15_14780 [Kiritimatiellae bacterium]|nr:hypothetical protein [Kiritimatiellia bacterium]
MFKNPILSLILGIVIGIIGKYAADIAYNKLRHGGLPPKMPYLIVDDTGNPQRAQVVLVPFEHFPQGSAAQLATILSTETKLRVVPTGNLNIPPKSHDKKRDQYSNERLLASLREYAPHPGDTLYIGLLADDMYAEGYNWNYSLASVSGRHIVLATDRYIPEGLNREKGGARLRRTNPQNIAAYDRRTLFSHSLLLRSNQPYVLADYGRGRH